MENEKHTPAPRVPLILDIEYRRSYGRQPEAGRLSNISLTGAFLETSTINFMPNDKIVLTLNVSGRERRLSASIIWKNERGCGVKFKPVNNRDVQIVDDLMYFVENSRTSRRTVLTDIFKKVA